MALQTIDQNVYTSQELHSPLITTSKINFATALQMPLCLIIHTCTTNNKNGSSAYETARC